MRFGAGVSKTIAHIECRRVATFAIMRMGVRSTFKFAFGNFDIMNIRNGEKFVDVCARRRHRKRIASA